MERRPAAILAADVVGYSRLMGQDETPTLAALKPLRSERIDRLRQAVSDINAPWYEASRRCG